MFKDVCARLLFVCLIALSLNACGREDGSELNETNKKPLFVSMGGNKSCGTDSDRRSYSAYTTSMFTYSKAYVWGPKAAQAEWNFLASCHTTEATVYHLSSQEPNTVRAAHIDDFYGLIKQLARESSGVYLAGHSYGGWLAMKAVLEFSEDEEFRDYPLRLYTVDPISRVHCSFATPGGCRSAPQDFSTTQKERIAEQTLAWQNFYQTNTWYLHSSEIEESDENHHIDSSHTNIDGTRSVWEQISSNVKAQNPSLLVYQ